MKAHATPPVMVVVDEHTVITHPSELCQAVANLQSTSDHVFSVIDGEAGSDGKSGDQTSGGEVVAKLQLKDQLLVRRRRFVWIDHVCILATCVLTLDETT